MRRFLPILAFACLCGAQTAPTATTLAGKVTDALTRLPVDHAQVACTLGAGEFTALTDANGDYRFDGLPPGNGSISVKPAGYAAFTEPEIELHAGDSETRDFQLKPLSSISGTVSDPDTGAALSGMVVAFRRDTVEGIVRYPSRKAAPIRDGRFEIRDLDPAGYVLLTLGSGGQARVPNTSWFPDVPRSEDLPGRAPTGPIEIVNPFPPGAHGPVTARRAGSVRYSEPSEQTVEAVGASQVT